MTRKMYDSVTVSDLPSDGDLYLGYVDGAYANAAAVQQRFPHKKVVKVTVTGKTLDAQVADVEPGDLTPAAGAAWAKRKVAAGQHPTLYCMASQWGEVRNAVHAAGIAGKVSYFIAQYDGRAVVPTGAVAKQYLGSPGNSPGHYDVSVVVDYWPGVDQNVATDLSAISRILASRLTARLSRRTRPVAKGKKILQALADQLHRILNLK